MLTIHSTNQLSSDEKKQVMSVFKACQQVDQSHKLPYLANSFNLDQDMPCFFLAYQNDHLIGFLTVYADEWEDAELGLFVHPDYRRKGVARSLYQAFCQMTEIYPIEAVSFVTEQVFLENNPDLATVWGLEIDPGVDFLMSLPEYQAVLSDRDDVVVDLAGKEDVQAIAQFQSTVFETPIELTRLYAKQSLSEQNVLLYLIKKDHQVIGSTSVDISTDHYFFFGLAMREDYQGQGLGYYFIHQVLLALAQRGKRPYQLAVEDSNHIARCFYEKLGFTYQTQVLYLKKPL